MPLSGREKATIFLSILGTDAAAKVLRYLPGELADLIAQGIKRLPHPSDEAMAAVLGEFKKMAALPGQEEVRPAIGTSVPSLSKGMGEALIQADPKRVANVLRLERPQVIAFVLSALPLAVSTELLTLIPEQRREVEDMMYERIKTPLGEELRDKIIAKLVESV